MRIIKIKKYQGITGETSKRKVAEALFMDPEEERTQSDLAREAGIAKQNIRKITEDLRKEGIIIVGRLGRTWKIKANMENEHYKNNKIAYNLNFIYNSGLIEFLVEHFNNPKTIILFGSFIKGEDSASSDIDIAVYKEKEKYKTLELEELKKFEKAINRKIQIHLFNKENVDNNLFNNIANGILLFGFLEVKK
ncbi:hypothetical protein COU61_01105 [Candidatus Pacearchaeota archaeon CG10_big_fil_rev_8_21_14_0_10_35_13]|nr:MAG: hypothetical protein COU61_01105 [Candidatus Pacearchaeota archaeon CG10_big_fil_rev_8_21_14_0_10_35_13]